MAEYNFPERVDVAINELIALAKREKPGDRSERDRYYAIFITDLEKAQAFYFYHCGITPVTDEAPAA